MTGWTEIKLWRYWGWFVVRTLYVRERSLYLIRSSWQAEQFFWFIMTPMQDPPVAPTNQERLHTRLARVDRSNSYEFRLRHEIHLRLPNPKYQHFSLSSIINIIVKKTISSLQRLLRRTYPPTRRSKTANITKKWYCFAAHRHNVTVLRSNIIFCDICCFRSASWRMSSLKGVVNC